MTLNIERNLIWRFVVCSDEVGRSRQEHVLDILEASHFADMFYLSPVLCSLDRPSHARPAQLPVWLPQGPFKCDDLALWAPGMKSFLFLVSVYILIKLTFRYCRAVRFVLWCVVDPQSPVLTARNTSVGTRVVLTTDAVEQLCRRLGRVSSWIG